MVLIGYYNRPYITILRQKRLRDVIEKEEKLKNKINTVAGHGYSFI